MYITTIYNQPDSSYKQHGLVEKFFEGQQARFRQVARGCIKVISKDAPSKNLKCTTVKIDDKFFEKGKVVNFRVHIQPTKMHKELGKYVPLENFTDVVKYLDRNIEKLEGCSVKKITQCNNLSPVNIQKPHNLFCLNRWDVAGQLEIDDTTMFKKQLLKGFPGCRGKAFGLGMIDIW